MANEIKKKNPNKGRIAIVVALVVVLLVVLIIGISNNNKDNVDISALPIERRQIDASIDFNEPVEVVSSADYYVVLKIDAVKGTEYRNEFTHEKDGKEVTHADPYTHYEATVLKSIKGDLPEDSKIEFVKSGGVAKDSKSVILYENDSLPKENSICVVALWQQDNGEMLASGPNTSIDLEVNDLDELKGNGKLDKLESYYEKSKSLGS